jgi:hypothetical protein
MRAPSRTLKRKSNDESFWSRDAALQTLSQSVPAIKRRIVVACTACILANQQVTVREAELLRAICDSLDCPLPPLVVGEAKDFQK